MEQASDLIPRVRTDAFFAAVVGLMWRTVPAASEYKGVVTVCPRYNAPTVARLDHRMDRHVQPG